ncbi:hypothetical protein KGV77_004208 [Escherichia coli]|nr:hypothetical protein [Escherichia coli]
MISNANEVINIALSIQWIIIALFLIFSGGIGFFLRLVFKPLKIDFPNEVTKGLDDELLDLQLLRLYHGVNVATQHDKDRVFLAMREGVLHPNDFKYLYFAPQIGIRKRSKLDRGVKYFMLLTGIVTMIFLSLWVRNDYKYNYASFISGGETVMVSDVYVYDPDADIYYNKMQCRDPMLKSKGIVKPACNYLVSTDRDIKEMLKYEISENNSLMKRVGVSLSFLYFISVMVFILYYRFNKTNDIFIDFKLSLIKRNDNNHVGIDS